MRTYVLCVVLLLLFLVPIAAFGQKNTSVKDDASSDSVITENWKTLDDLKTGLSLQPPIVVQKDEMTDFVREFIRVQWRPGDPIDLYVMRPKTPEKVPVVLYLYSYPADADNFLDNRWCKRVTQNGFAAVGFVSALTGQRYRNRPMKEWFVSELEESLGSSVHDVQLILNYLASRSDLDMDHVGMVGQGSGASIAILAAQADPRIKALDLIDPWGDWADWLRETPAVAQNDRPKFTTDEFLNSVSTLDPVRYLPNLKTPSIRIQQILTDPVTPKSAKDRIAASVSSQAQLVRYANSQEHLKAWQVTGLSGWIKERLRPQVVAGTGAGTETGAAKQQP